MPTMVTECHRLKDQTTKGGIDRSNTGKIHLNLEHRGFIHRSHEIVAWDTMSDGSYMLIWLTLSWYHLLSHQPILPQPSSMNLKHYMLVSACSKDKRGIENRDG